ncbi:type VI secretion system-associated FHA domain protein TagH [Paracoccaceae bacterium Fryx2]|nr:type VI secretion system-associated FHA domain protein TagH [Paracoccaceae bacterium Fryx2]
MAVTLRFQSTGTVPGNGRPITMNGPSLTIGRGDENDLVLPDPEKLISKRHCAIEDHAGNIIVVDFSTNGTFLNYGKVPLGRVATPLNDGDILTMGTYELVVEITYAKSAAAGIPAPLEDGPVSHGRADASPDLMSLLDDTAASGRPGAVDFLDELLGASVPDGPSRVKRPELGDDGLLPPLGEDAAGGMLSARPDPYDGLGASQSSHSPAMQDSFVPPRTARPASTIPDDWDEDFLSPAPRRPEAEPAPPPLAAPVFIPDDLTDFGPEPDAAPPPPAPAFIPDHLAGLASTPTPPTPPAPPPGPRPVADDVAARAFLRATGADHLPISDEELVPTLSRLGHVLRILIHGMREVLMTRSSIKSEFRIQQTVIGAGGNNPLKFSISPEQAVEAMVKPMTRGYLDAAEAAEQAMRDIKAHEIAMMTGMEAAMKGILKRLDPAALEGKIATSAGIGSILKGRKALYWEAYEKMYAEISDQAENDFHELFAREFARAYQAQLERLK